MVFSAQLAEGGGSRPPPPFTLSTPSTPLELRRPLRPSHPLHSLPSKTSEIMIPVLFHNPPLPFYLVLALYSVSHLHPYVYCSHRIWSLVYQQS